MKTNEEMKVLKNTVELTEEEMQMVTGGDIYHWTPVASGGLHIWVNPAR